MKLSRYKGSHSRGKRDFSKVILIILFVLFALGFADRAGLLEVAPVDWFVSGYQGLDIGFYAVKYKGKWFYEGNPPIAYNPPALTISGPQLNFDPDEQYKGVINLGGELAAPVLYDYCRSKPVKVIEWEFQLNSTHKMIISGGVYHLKWEFNIWVTSDMINFDDPWDDELGGITDCEVWFIIKPMPLVGFKDAYYTAFAPIYMEVESAEWLRGDPSEQELNPEQRGASFPIFKSLGGVETIDENTILKYKGRDLDPNVFSKQYYTRLIVKNMYIPYLARSTILGGWVGDFPSVKYTVRIHVLAIGKWILPLKERFELEQHQTSEGWSFWTEFYEWINNPFNFALLSIIILIILAYLFMPVIIAYILKGKQS